MKYTKDDIQNATERLTKLLKPGTTVYTSLKHVSRSGMMRHIGLHVTDNGEIKDITYFVGILTDYSRDSSDGGLKVGGCGMDMGFHIVYGLSRRLFPNGFKCVGDKCQSNDHFNGDCPKRSEMRGRKHKGDGGYALNQRWL